MERATVIHRTQRAMTPAPRARRASAFWRALCTALLALSCASSEARSPNSQTVAARPPAPTPDEVVGEAVAASGSTRKLADGLGLVVKFSQGQPLSDLSTLKELGISWVRDTVAWADVEKEPGVYGEFPEDFQKRLTYYRDNGIGIVYLLAYGNSKAYPPSSAAPYRHVDPRAFARYAAAMARRFRAFGVDFVLEVWNEPHNFLLRPLLGGEWNGKPPSPWLDHYVSMVRETMREVRAFDNTVRVLTDEDMYVIHYWFLEKGLPSDIGGFAFHPYTVGEPERAPVNWDTDWTQPHQVVDVDGSFNSAVRRLREQGISKLGRTPELWITEWGWAVGQKSRGVPLTEENIAQFLPRAYVLAEAAGVEASCWFSARDTVDGPMGLIANDGRKRQAYYALRSLYQELGEYSYAGQLFGKTTPTTGVQAFLFKGAKDMKIVAWDVDGAAKLLLPESWGAAPVVNYLRTSVPVSRDATGKRYLGLGAALRYITLPAAVPNLKVEIAP